MKIFSNCPINFPFCSHFELLVNHSSLPECFKMMNNILIHIKQRMFMHSAEENAVRGIGMQKLMVEIFDASNFDVGPTFSDCH